MIGFFPTVLPDELLYSAYARYRSALGITGHDRAHAALFGAGRGRAAVELPRDLDALVRRLPGDGAYTVARLVAAHTTLPYYRPFKRPEHVARVEARMGAAAPATTRHLMLGGTRVVTPPHLVLCPDCVAADRRAHGVAYWHRAHQLPGVRCCHHHGARLRPSGIGRTDRGAERGYHAVEEVLAANTATVTASVTAANTGGRTAAGPAVDVPSADGPAAGGPAACGPAACGVQARGRGREPAVLLGLARDTAWLLAADTAGPGLDALRRRYHAALEATGLMRGVYVRVPALRDHVASYYGAEFLASLGCGLVGWGLNDHGAGTRAVTGRPAGTDWLARLVQKPHAALHPLQHLLLARALGLSLEELLAGGTSPTPGLPADPPRVGGSGAAGPRTTDAPAADTTASGAAPDVSPGDVAVAALRPADRSDAPRTRRADQRLAYRERARRVYEGLRDDHPAVGRAALEVLAPREVPWLRRHDAAWLAAHQPPWRGARRAGPLVDWPARDEGLRWRVTAAVARLLAPPPAGTRPRRVTVNAVLCAMGRPALAADLPRLPQTNAALQAATESVAAFAERRLAWAAAQCAAEGAAPTAAALQTRASLSLEDRRRLRERADALARGLAAGPAA